jgi:hypothetical protein
MLNAPVSHPFEIYAADEVQGIQFIFLQNCRDLRELHSGGWASDGVHPHQFASASE